MAQLPERVLPDEFEKLASLAPDLERLAPDTEDSCPRPRSEIFEYACLEALGFTEDIEDGADDKYFVLTFLRTAKIEDRSYWIWLAECAEESTRDYVLVEKSQRYPNTLTGLRDAEEFTPEQFIWGDFCDVYGDGA